MSRSTENSSSRDRRVAHRSRFDAAGDESVTVTVCQALAAAHGREAPDTVLYEHIDPDALESFVEHAADGTDVTWELEFAAGEFDVAVSSDGWITVSRSVAKRGRRS